MVNIEDLNYKDLTKEEKQKLEDIENQIKKRIEERKNNELEKKKKEEEKKKNKKINIDNEIIIEKSVKKEEADKNWKKKGELEPVDKTFLKKRTFFGLGKEKEVTGEEIKKKSPLLIYIDEDLIASTYTNVKAGFLSPIDKISGRQKINHNKILPERRIIWNYGGEQIPIYIQYENEMFNYPLNTKLDAKEVVKLLKTMQANYKELDEKTGLLGKLSMQQVKMWLFLIGGLVGIVLAGYFLGNTFGLWEGLGWFQAGKEAVTTVAINTS